MAEVRLLLETILPLLLIELILVEIESTIRTSNRFSSPEQFAHHLPFNESELDPGFIPSRNFYSQFQFPTRNPPLSLGFNTFAPPFQRDQHLYAKQGPGEGDTLQRPGEYFKDGEFPYYTSTVSLPLGYFPPQFGGSATRPFSSSNPYTVPNPTTASFSYPRLTPATKFQFPKHQIPHHTHYQGHFHPPPPPEFQNGFDVGFLPTQVRVPGLIQVTMMGKDAQISCEFPKYLILIQGIYWHHHYEHDPFGSYFDSQNGFGGRTTVQSVDQWKSLLTIREYSIDDVGTYRCISSAVLPAKTGINPETTSPATSKTSQGNSRFEPITTASASPPPYSFDPSTASSSTGPSATNSASAIDSSPSSEQKKQRVSRYTKNSRKMRFPHLGDVKVRFTRNVRNEATPIDSGKNELSSEENRRYYNVLPTPSFAFQDPNFNYNRLTNPYVDPYLQHSGNPLQNKRHQYHPHFYFGYPRFELEFPLPISHSAPAPTTGFGLQVPYYKPAFSYSTIYQEIKFQPNEGAAGAARLGSQAWL